MFLFSLECCFASELLCCCSITSNNHQGVNGDGRGFLGSLLVSVGGSMPLSTCWGDESGARKQLLRPNPNTGGTRRCGLRVLEVSFLQMCPLSYSIGLPVLQQPCALSSEYVTLKHGLSLPLGRKYGWEMPLQDEQRAGLQRCLCLNVINLVPVSAGRLVPVRLGMQVRSVLVYRTYLELGATLGLRCHATQCSWDATKPDVGQGTQQPFSFNLVFSTSRAVFFRGKKAGWEGKVLLVVLTEVANCLGRPCLRVMRLLLSLLLPHQQGVT